VVRKWFERLLQGFAFLTARLRGQIDDDMSDFTHSLLSLLWPNFLRPFPATTMMKFSPLERSITKAQVINAGSTILSRPQSKNQCLFQTSTDCTIYPLEIQGIELERLPDRSRLRLSFATLANMPLSRIELTDLRLTLSGNEATRQMLYLWLGRHLKKALIQFGDGTHKMLDHNRQLSPIGFATDEALLPQQSSEFEGHRLLREYFTFPDKFYGYDIKNLSPLFADREDGAFTLEFEFDRVFPLHLRVERDSIRLYCVPAVNLSTHLSDVIFPQEGRIFYPLKAGGLHSDDLEIFSVDGVQRPKAEEKKRASLSYLNYDSLRRIGHNHTGDTPLYYRLRRKPQLQSKNFSHDLFFVHHNNEIAHPTDGSLVAQLTCFNREGSENINIGDIDIATDKLPSFVRYHNITPPTPVIYPPHDGQFNWQLISNLSLHDSALLNRERVAAILSLYDYAARSDRQAERTTKRRIDAITSFASQPIDRLFAGRPLRGVKSRMELDENAFETEGAAYLFTRILSKFFTLTVTTNSFHELEVCGKEPETHYLWPPQQGQQPLI